MLDHVTIGVSDFKRSRHFYDQALHPLEIVRLYADGENAAGFGIHPKAFFWISGRDAPQSGAHIAFAAKDHNTVERFYEAAIKAGGKDNGSPGIREHYHPHYFGAFVLDLDGHNIEAVCHTPRL